MGDATDRGLKCGHRMPNQAAAGTFRKAHSGPWAGGGVAGGAGAGSLMRGPLRPRSLRYPGHSLGPRPSPATYAPSSPPAPPQGSSAFCLPRRVWEKTPPGSPRLHRNPAFCEKLLRPGSWKPLVLQCERRSGLTSFLTSRQGASQSARLALKRALDIYRFRENKTFRFDPKETGNSGPAPSSLRWRSLRLSPQHPPHP